MFGLSGSAWTLLGVSLTVAGTQAAYYGTRLIDRENATNDRRMLDLQEENSELSREIARQAQEIASQATGGNSFVYFSASGFGTTDTEARILHSGRFPVKDIEFSIFDVSKQLPAPGDAYDLREEDRTIARLWRPIYPHSIEVVRKFPFETDPKDSTYSYYITYVANSGFVRQELRFRHTKAGWKQGYRVQRITDDGFETVLEHRDAGFQDKAIPPNSR